MPMFSQFGAFGLAGWVLFFFAAAVGSGNFPGNTDLINIGCTSCDLFVVYNFVINILNNVVTHRILIVILCCVGEQKTGEDIY